MRVLSLVTLIFCSGLAFVVNARAEALGRISSGALSAVLSADTDLSYQLKVKLRDEKISAENFNLFFIENPSRLVVDITGVAAAGAKEILVDSQYIERVRLGTHPDKVRVVIDIYDGYFPVYEIKPITAAGEILIDFSLSSAKIFEKPKEVISKPMPTSVDAMPTEPVAVVSQVDEPELDEAEEMVADDFSSDFNISEEIELEQVKDDLEERLRKLALEEIDNSAELNAEIIDTRMPQLPVGNMVQDISFESVVNEKRNSVVIKVQNFDEYSLMRREDGRYELTLKNCSLVGKHLALPFFPPKEFIGLQLVHGKQDSDGVSFSFHVDPGTRLVPHRSDEGLRVNVLP